MVEEVSETHYPFESVGQALQFLNDCNPARARSINLLEPEFGHKPQDWDAPQDVWASVLLAVERVLALEQRQAVEIWELCNRGDRSKQMTPTEAAAHIGVDKRWAFRVLRRIRNGIEEELIRRRLMAPREEDPKVIN